MFGILISVLGLDFFIIFSNIDMYPKLHFTSLKHVPCATPRLFRIKCALHLLKLWEKQKRKQVDLGGLNPRPLETTYHVKQVKQLRILKSLNLHETR